MTPAESRQLTELTNRLFGDDGQGGALGRIERKVDGIDDRTRSLELDRAKFEGASQERDRERKRFYSRNSLLMGLAAAMGALLGPVIATALGMLR